jgi:hypothetical protein
MCPTSARSEKELPDRELSLATLTGGAEATGVGELGLEPSVIGFSSSGRAFHMFTILGSSAPRTQAGAQ